MKLATRWRRVYNPIIGVRFFDAGDYGLGFFTIEKLWECNVYSEHAVTPEYSHWFTKRMMQIRTDKGLVYKMPFIPWMDVYDSKGKKSMGDYYNENPRMDGISPKRRKRLRKK